MGVIIHILHKNPTVTGKTAMVTMPVLPTG